MRENANTERKRVDIEICIRSYLARTHTLQIHVHINVLFSQSEAVCVQHTHIQIYISEK